MTAPTLVITGANGFVGSHVAALAAADGVKVWAVGREPEPAAQLAPHCDEYFQADLESQWPVPDEIDAIVHLAGLAAVGASFEQPQRYLTVNSGIVTMMCQTLLSGASRPRIVVVSSGSVYAPPADAQPIDETAALTPTSPYAVAKILVEAQAAYYARRGLDTLIARPFNHIGPGQSTGFLLPDLTAALEQLPAGDALHVGNLAAERDFTDVRDVARAYVTLALSPSHQHHLYNVCSGSAHSGYEVLTTIAEALDRPLPETRTDPSRLRPDDPPHITGSAARINGEFGWAPTIPWRQSIFDYVSQRS